MTYPYQNSALPIDQRVDDLLSRMTLDEKLAQMSDISLPEKFTLNQNGDVDLPEQGLAHGIGAVSRLGVHLTSRQTAEVANAIQRKLVTQTRLGIPAFIIDEALHGLMAQGATSFPQAIGLASTWDRSLVRRVFAIAAVEARARGTNWVLSPVLDLARDPRWGRTEETYSEDPYLAGQMGVAAVQGFQGQDLRTGVMATTKHFAVHGQPESGTNAAPGNFSEREIRTVFLEPFRAAIREGGARAVMASYNEINGIPAHINEWLLKDILRREWGFDGLLTSDGFGISDLYKLHHVAEDKTDAGRQALLTGIDFELDSCFALLKDQIRSGELSEAHIDRAVRQVLHEKFSLGLFDNPYATAEDPDEVAHNAVALEAARKAIILLKNDNKLLPLDITKLRRIAVIGPNAAPVMQGGYSAEPAHPVSLLDGIRQYVAQRAEVLYSEGCRITEDGGGYQGWWRHEVRLPDPAEEAQRIAAALEVARQADVVILAMGENESICREGWGEMHLGDRDSLDLPGQQEALLQAIMPLGKPTVLILFNGRPLTIRWAAEHVPAILECWYLGQQGGTALAETLFGEVNPGGKLPITIPRSVGQIPAYYYHKPSARRGYLFTSNVPLFPFGHGLSYTEFEFSDLTITPEVAVIGQEIRASVSVRNSGQRSGDEVVQLYLRDCVSSVTRPVKELKGFERITLAPGQQQQVTFTITPDMLAFWNKDMQWAVEPGQFEVMIGSSSTQGLTGQFRVTSAQK